MTKDELIHALEAATGPSRELDAEIAALTRVLPGFPRHEYVAPATMEAREDGSVDCYVAAPGRVPQRVERVRAPIFTASIDAALSLVPEGRWAKTVRGEDGCGYAAISTDSSAIKFRCDRAATPAIALCIAALRARP